MGQIGVRDLKAALELTLQAQAAETVEELRVGLMSGLRGLVACDVIGYNEVDLKNQNALGIVDPPDAAIADLEARFMAVVHEHPMAAAQQAGDLSTRALSDFFTVRQFHNLSLYQDFYKGMQHEDQLAFGLGGEVLVAYALSRDRRTFTERDRSVLELVRPHLTLAYQQARRRELDRAFMQALGAGLEERHLGVIQLDGRGRIVHATGCASELLDAYLGPGTGNGLGLPPWLLAWVDDPRGEASRQELVLEGERGRLRVRRQMGGESDRWRSLMLEEQRPSPPSVDALCSLGLTTRQAQVLRLVACGKSNPHVAGELQISTATVEKHLEHIYDRLGVSSRGEAIARVYR